MGERVIYVSLLDSVYYQSSLLGSLAEALVKFAYNKSEDDELNLHVGDVVTNVVEVSSKDILRAQAIGLL